MAKLRIILDTRRALAAQPSDETNQKPSYPLKLSVFINGKGRFMVNTGIAIPKDNWMNDTIKGLPQKDIYNNVLRTRLNQADNELLRLDIAGELAKLSLVEIKKRITDIIRHKVDEPVLDEKGCNIADYFKEFISGKDREGTKSIYEQTLAKMGRYYDLEKLSFRDVNLVWLREFEKKMKQDELSVNTISIHFRNLRAVFNNAIDEDVIGQECYPFRKFKIKTERTVKRSLTVEQLRMLRDYPCQEHQVKYRDMFMLTFYLMGVNMVDLVALKEVSNGRVEFRRAKTGRLYSMKVEPEAIEIIERYRGEKYLVDICDNYVNYKDFLHRMNNNLQEIGPFERVGQGGKKVYEPLFPGLTTYWARHTWATVAAGLDIPKETIAAALGHGGNTVTDIYIDFDQRKVDAANRRVIDYL